MPVDAGETQAAGPAFPDFCGGDGGGGGGPSPSMLPPQPPLPPAAVSPEPLPPEMGAAFVGAAAMPGWSRRTSGESAPSSSAAARPEIDLPALIATAVEHRSARASAAASGSATPLRLSYRRPPLMYNSCQSLKARARWGPAAAAPRRAAPRRAAPRGGDGAPGALTPPSTRVRAGASNCDTPLSPHARSVRLAPPRPPQVDADTRAAVARAGGLEHLAAAVRDECLRALSPELQPLALHVTALEGCLQLIVTIFQRAAAAATGARPAAAIAADTTAAVMDRAHQRLLHTLGGGGAASADVAPSGSSAAGSQEEGRQLPDCASASAAAPAAAAVAGTPLDVDVATVTPFGPGHPRVLEPPSIVRICPAALPLLPASVGKAVTRGGAPVGARWRLPAANTVELHLSAPLDPRRHAVVAVCGPRVLPMSVLRYDGSKVQFALGELPPEALEGWPAGGGGAVTATPVPAAIHFFVVLKGAAAATTSPHPLLAMPQAAALQLDAAAKEAAVAAANAAAGAAKSRSTEAASAAAAAQAEMEEVQTLIRDLALALDLAFPRVRSSGGLGDAPGGAALELLTGVMTALLVRGLNEPCALLLNLAADGGWPIVGWPDAIGCGAPPVTAAQLDAAMAAQHLRASSGPVLASESLSPLPGPADVPPEVEMPSLPPFVATAAALPDFSELPMHRLTLDLPVVIDCPVGEPLSGTSGSGGEAYGGGVVVGGSDGGAGGGRELPMSEEEEAEMEAEGGDREQREAVSFAGTSAGGGGGVRVRPATERRTSAPAAAPTAAAPTAEARPAINLEHVIASALERRAESAAGSGGGAPQRPLQYRRPAPPLLLTSYHSFKARRLRRRCAAARSAAASASPDADAARPHRPICRARAGGRPDAGGGGARRRAGAAGARASRGLPGRRAARAAAAGAARHGAGGLPAADRADLPAGGGAAIPAPRRR